MKSISAFFFFSFVCLLISCSDEDLDLEPLPDLEGPELTNLRWIGYPNIGRVITIPIENGGDYVVSKELGYQFHTNIKDMHLITGGTIYALINDDPNLKKTMLSEGGFSKTKELSYSFSSDPNEILTGDGEFYKLQLGDRYHFHAKFSDELGNNSSMFWTATLVE